MRLAGQQDLVLGTHRLPLGAVSDDHRGVPAGRDGTQLPGGGEAGAAAAGKPGPADLGDELAAPPIVPAGHRQRAVPGTVLGPAGRAAALPLRQQPGQVARPQAGLAVRLPVAGVRCVHETPAREAADICRGLAESGTRAGPPGPRRPPARAWPNSRASTAVATATADPTSISATHQMPRSLPAVSECRNAAGQAR